MILIVNKFNKIKDSGISDLFIANFLIAFFAFGSQIFVSGALNPSDIGRIKIFQSYIQLGTIFSLFGINTTVIKFCSDDNYKDKKLDIFIFSLVLSTLLSIIITLIFWFLTRANLLTNDSTLYKYFINYSNIIIPITLSQIVLGFYQSQKLYRKFSLIQLYTKLFFIISILIGTYLYGLDGYMFFYFLSTFLGIVYLAVVLNKNFAIAQNKIRDSAIRIKSFIRLYLSYSVSSFITSFNTQINSLIGLFLLNHLVNDLKEIGYYSFALIIILGFRLINQTTQQFLVPIFSGESSKKKLLLSKYKRYSKKFFFFLSTIFILSQIIVPEAIILIFGEKYKGSLIYIRLELVFWFFYGLTTVKSALLIGGGYVHYSARLSTVVMFLSLLINFILINLMGVIGAALADVLNNMISYLLHRYYINKIALNEN